MQLKTLLTRGKDILRTIETSMSALLFPNSCECSPFASEGLCIVRSRVWCTQSSSLDVLQPSGTVFKFDEGPAPQETWGKASRVPSTCLFCEHTTWLWAKIVGMTPHKETHSWPLDWTGWVRGTRSLIYIRPERHLMGKNINVHSNDLFGYIKQWRKWIVVSGRLGS